VGLPIFVSESWHDYIHWPLIDSKVYKKWRKETTWGHLFADYDEKGVLGKD